MTARDILCNPYTLHHPRSEFYELDGQLYFIPAEIQREAHRDAYRKLRRDLLGQDVDE